MGLEGASEAVKDLGVMGREPGDAGRPMLGCVANPPCSQQKQLHRPVDDVAGPWEMPAVSFECSKLEESVGVGFVQGVAGCLRVHQHPACVCLSVHVWGLGQGEPLAAL